MPNGRCLCGAVQYETSAAFIYAGNCHCSQCRQASGAAFNSFAGVPLDALRVTAGEEQLSSYAKGRDSVLRFCKVCGSNLFSIKPEAGVAHIRMGTLTEEPGIAPKAHLFVGSKAPWQDITDDLPQFQEHAPRVR
ncbi:GFA family protein [Uliginosibacterium sp. H1]|uniref:GFA family protein n=1 Tax=Uliginosibacterium sp. H1 TaxID=3114757 RepID=UPI003FCC51AC